MQSLSREQIQAVQSTHPDEFQNADKEFDFLAKHIVIGAFRRVRKQIVHARFLSINNQFVHFLKSLPHILDLAKYNLNAADWQANIEKTVAGIKNGAISMSDVSAYLYLFDKISGKRPKTDIRYLFIDEVQDYTAFQMAFLKFTFPRARFTLLGDLNQAIFTHENSHHLLKELGTMFNPEKTNVVQLTKSYRSTEQITDFTKHILGDGEAIEAFAREGEKPLVEVYNDDAAAITHLKDKIALDQQKHDTTTIICKTLAECKTLYAELQANNIEANLIQTENQRLLKGTLIIPSYLAKGLEFDSVIMWDASADVYSDESDRQLVYTICTRAMHELTIIAKHAVTPILDRVPKELYIMK